MDDYVFRPATEADEGGILDIKPFEEIYDGWDYLPINLSYMIRSESFGCFVCLLGNEIIAFTSLHLIDDGTSVVERASRVKKTFRGRGVHKCLIKYALDNFLAGKMIRRLVEVANIFQICSKSLVKNMYKRTILMETDTVEVSGKAMLTDFLESSVCVSSLGVCDISLNDLANIFRHREICRRIFPHDMCLIDWVPYKLLKSNLRFQAADNPFGLPLVVVDPSLTPVSIKSTEQTLRVTTMESIEERQTAEYGNESSKSQLSLSIGTTRKCRFGLMYEVNFYGEDVFLDDHIKRHLVNTRHLITTKDRVFLSLVFHMSPMSLHTVERYRSILNKLGLAIAVSDMHGPIRIYEKVLR